MLLHEVRKIEYGAKKWQVIYLDLVYLSSIYLREIFHPHATLLLYVTDNTCILSLSLSLVSHIIDFTLG